ncbi:MAG TPA: bifunctional hydroxymethylpyrimidine kinase/phosphomethylpyrimidine kinase [Chlorobaculum parvum]|uniref:hydroxymethylpyrimidine kinase n=1 Tax=Chlorobaculum parvum TaxID=274539 RepID=A0A7C5HKX5_9CHLB|nr:bifunctional hydroxymethylpyrimidine kinase/phosphomethylpyrimidine kinase [Chlorobaculum parvum]
MKPREYTTVLTIAGSDGSGGAGIQADLKTIAAHSCYGLSVITAVTAQSTMDVAGGGVHAIPPDFIAQQFETIVSDIRIDAVKIGMLGPAENAETIAALIARLNAPIVLDTVLRSSSGVALFAASTTAAMKRLFPLVSLITPNLPEAAALTGRSSIPADREQIEEIARELQAMGAPSVLVKGGHWEGESCHDCLLHNQRFHWFSNPKITTVNTHGTGCTLSSAIASGLALELEMPEAVTRGIDYTRRALESGANRRLGHGTGPLQHFPDQDENRVG